METAVADQLLGLPAAQPAVRTLDVRVIIIRIVRIAKSRQAYSKANVDA